MYENGELFYAFYQGEVASDENVAGNCASVALIKAAIARFGIGHVFQTEGIENGYKVKLRNGKEFSLNKNELEKAKTASALQRGTGSNEDVQRLYDEILDYAHLCFAVIVKYVYIYGEVCENNIVKKVSSFDEAVKSVNDGLYTPLCYYHLGLENHIRKMKRLSSTNGLNAIVGWSLHHAVYINDQRYDNRGEPEGMTPKYYGRFQIIDK